MVLLQTIKDIQRAECVRDASELLHHIVVRTNIRQDVVFGLMFCKMSGCCNFVFIELCVETAKSSTID